MATATKSQTSKTKTKKYTAKSDDAYDRKNKIKEDSKKDKALDKKRGISEKSEKKGKK